MRFYAMRHGRTALNAQGIVVGALDDPLTDEGRTQARGAALNMPLDVRYIYTSPLVRAHETANIVNEERGLPVSVSSELREVDFGAHNGALFSPELRELHESMTYNWRPEGESLEDVRVRVSSFLNHLKTLHEDGEVLLVTHGGIIRLLHYMQHRVPVGRVENASIHEFSLENVLAAAVAKEAGAHPS